MDVTHPARWLHSGSAPVHPPILEYHQGTWHGIHLIVHSPHSPSRTRTKTNKQGKHLFAPTQRCPPCRTSTGLWWKKSQTSTRELASNSSCVCHCFTKFPTSTFFSFFFVSASRCDLLLPARSFLPLLSIFCRRCTFTARTPPTSSHLPATRPAGAPGSITVSARLVFSHPSVDVSSSWLGSMFVGTTRVQRVVCGN